MRLRCLLLGLLAPGLLAGPVVAQPVAYVEIVEVDRAGKVIVGEDSLATVAPGRRIAWTCNVQDPDTSVYKLRVHGIKQQSPGAKQAPFGNGFTFDKTEQCGQLILSGPMRPQARFFIYGASFEISKVTSSSTPPRKEVTDRVDPHWVVFP